jgi:hypothetical protein
MSEPFLVILYLRNTSLSFGEGRGEILNTKVI